jgi:hypothetical protein
LIITSIIIDGVSIITDLTEVSLNEAIPTDFLLAAQVTPVKVGVISVIAGLVISGLNKAISADLKATLRATVIPWVDVAIIAIFIGLDLCVPTLFDHALRVTAIGVELVPVITPLGAVDLAISTL